MRATVIVFPGSNCDRDVKVALEAVTGRPAQMVWHGDPTLPASDLIVLPGGFLLRGLPALRRDGGALGGDARRGGEGEGRDAGARHLQRLPDPVRIRAVARHPDAQRVAALHLPRRASAGGADGHAATPPAMRRAK